MATQSGATTTVVISAPAGDSSTINRLGYGTAYSNFASNGAEYTFSGTTWDLAADSDGFESGLTAIGASGHYVIINGGTTYEFVGTTTASTNKSDLEVTVDTWIANDPGGDVAAFTPAAGSSYSSQSDFTTMRLTDRNGPSLEVGELTSGEVSAERQETSVRSGFQQVTGQLGFELSHKSQDALIELGTADLFSSMGDDVPVATDAWNASATYTPGSGMTDLDSLIPANNGTYVRVVLADNSGDALYSFLGLQTSATAITEIHTLGGERPDAPIVGGTANKVGVFTFDGSFVKKSSMKYATLVKDYPEIEVAQAFGGCTVNNLSFSIQPGSLVTGTADLLGLAATNMKGEGNPQGPFNYGKSGEFRNTPVANPGSIDGTTAYSPFASCLHIENIGSGICTGFDFSINNNRETIPMLCTPFADTVYEGVANVTGTITLLFENATEYNKFAAETSTKLGVTLAGGGADGSDSMFFFFPKVRYNQPSFEIPANGPVVLTLNFRSLQETFAGEETSCVIGRA